MPKPPNRTRKIVRISITQDRNHVRSHHPKPPGSVRYITVTPDSYVTIASTTKQVMNTKGSRAHAFRVYHTRYKDRARALSGYITHATRIARVRLQDRARAPSGSRACAFRIARVRLQDRASAPSGSRAYALTAARRHISVRHVSLSRSVVRAAGVAAILGGRSVVFRPQSPSMASGRRPSMAGLRIHARAPSPAPYAADLRPARSEARRACKPGSGAQRRAVSATNGEASAGPSPRVVAIPAPEARARPRALQAPGRGGHAVWCLRHEASARLTSASPRKAPQAQKSDPHRATQGRQRRSPKNHRPKTRRNRHNVTHETAGERGGHAIWCLRHEASARLTSASPRKAPQEEKTHPHSATHEHRRLEPA